MLPGYLRRQQAYLYLITHEEYIYITTCFILGLVLLGSSRGSEGNGPEQTGCVHTRNYVNPDCIRIYETSGRYSACYYTTTNELITQPLLDNAVSTWWGELEIGRCTAPDEPVCFENIRLLNGLVIDGKIESGRAMLQLAAWITINSQINGMKIRLKEGETLPVNLILN